MQALSLLCDDVHGSIDIQLLLNTISTISTVAEPMLLWAGYVHVPELLWKAAHTSEWEQYAIQSLQLCLAPTSANPRTPGQAAASFFMQQSLFNPHFLTEEVLSAVCNTLLVCSSSECQRLLCGVWSTM